MFYIYIYTNMHLCRLTIKYFEQAKLIRINVSRTSNKT